MLGQRVFSSADALAVRALSLKDSSLGRRVRSALEVIDQAIERYGDTLALSFNGGKDCTVLVHLYAAAVLPRLSPSSSPSSLPGTSSPPSTSTLSERSRTPHPPLACIYVQCQSPFPQVEEFVDQCRTRYRLDLTRISAPMKEALKRYKHQREYDHGKAVEAVLVGTRLGDPFADQLQAFTATDPDWPPLMRVHPILDWTYNDVWEFLRCSDFGEDGVGWCNLYNYGYTSLGSTFNTIPNPKLRDPAHPSGWKPAWELEDASSERAGRPAGPIPREVANSLDGTKKEEA